MIMYDFPPSSRSMTRRERYAEKQKTAEYLPVIIGCVNFEHDGNLAFVMRAAACFGVKEVHVIGSVPHRADLKKLSGSMCDLVDIVQHKNPRSFIEWCADNRVKIVAAELCEKSEKLRDYNFTFEGLTCIFTGHETSGVPGEIIHVADCVEIDMRGPGFCLNTAQTANIMLYEASKQYIGGAA